MLVRRFTIVCLLTALFGMAMAILVAEDSRQASTRPNNDGQFLSEGNPSYWARGSATKRQ